MNQNTNSNPNITQLTTDELIRQGYPPETAAKHPANVANLAPADPLQ